MRVPRIGVSLPHFGPYAGPDAVVTVAQAAEQSGFHAVSVSERLLMPVRSDWSNDAKLPESYAPTRCWPTSTEPPPSAATRCTSR
jgi:alkanesulfonate monooxygenase SsuD/methylene tetrahydromethanopterin reductase-like flavin-dependent oxidoreductase (luciferase family)